MVTIKDAISRTIVVTAVVMACALSIGRVRPGFKLPDVFPVWAWSNLLFTCTAEEALFRGVIQRQLQDRLVGWSLVLSPWSLVLGVTEEGRRTKD